MRPRFPDHGPVYKAGCLFAAIIVALPFLLIWLPMHFLYKAFIYSSVLILWVPRGKDVLFVSSESPNWKEYIEVNILPKIGDRAILINWSERKKWDRWSLSVMCFRHFRPYRDFNPMAIVFRPFRRAKVFCFRRAFRDYKHGRTVTLQGAEKAFFDYVHSSG